MSPYERVETYAGPVGRFWLGYACGVLGIAASAATIYALPLAGVATLSCGVEALDCAGALTSSFAKVAGIPLGVLGAGYFLFWLLCLRAFLLTSAEVYRVVLTWLGVAGAASSASLLFVMLAMLRKPCLYCLATHAANLGGLAALWPLRCWRAAWRSQRLHMRHLISLFWVAFLAGGVVFLANEARSLRHRVSVLKQQQADCETERRDLRTRLGIQEKKSW